MSFYIFINLVRMEKERLTGIIGIILGTLISIFAEEIKTIFPETIKYSFGIMIFIFMLFSIFLFFDFHTHIFSIYNKWKRWKSPIQVAVLNGLVNNKENKKRCTESKYQYRDWKNELEKYKNNNKDKFKISKICATQLSSKYTIIINPYHEIHFDKNRQTLDTFYNIILNYLKEGGIYVCTGGIPFYYVWHDVLGKPIDTTPKNIELEQGTLREFRAFSDTIFAKEFGVHFNGLDSAPAKVFQNSEDVAIFGNIV